MKIYRSTYYWCIIWWWTSILVGGDWNMIFILPYIGNNYPTWLLFFTRVETTNQWWNCYVFICSEDFLRASWKKVQGSSMFKNLWDSGFPRFSAILCPNFNSRTWGFCMFPQWLRPCDRHFLSVPKRVCYWGNSIVKSDETINHDGRWN